MSYRIMPDIPFVNNEGKCNNPSCPNPKIWWNKAVLNSDTGKQLPLDEPFTGLRPPKIHGCMEKYRPGMYINKYQGHPAPEPSPYPKVKASVIICSDPDCNTPIVERTEPLMDQLILHLQKYHNIKLNQDFIDIQQFKIDHLRSGRFAYTDPFLHIPWEDIIKNTIS